MRIGSARGMTRTGSQADKEEQVSGNSHSALTIKMKNFVISDGSIHQSLPDYSYWITRTLALVYLHIVVGICRPNVLGTGANQAIVVQLLDHMRGPAADARYRKNWRKQVYVDAERGVSGS